MLLFCRSGQLVGIMISVSLYLKMSECLSCVWDTAGILVYHVCVLFGLLKLKVKTEAPTPSASAAESSLKPESGRETRTVRTTGFIALCHKSSPKVQSRIEAPEHKRAVHRFGAQLSNNLNVWRYDNCSHICSPKIWLYTHPRIHC